LKEETGDNIYGREDIGSSGRYAKIDKNPEIGS
jgi:hypothetical protein